MKPSFRKSMISILGVVSILLVTIPVYGGTLTGENDVYNPVYLAGEKCW